MTGLDTERAGFDATFVAVGAHLSKHADIPARETGRIVYAVPFLREVAAGGHPVLGRRVAVYGGGNTAMDAARTAKRLGAGDALHNGMDQQYHAVASGYWPLIRYDPVTRAFLPDSPRPRLRLSSYTGRELRFRILHRTDPEAVARLAELAAQEVCQRWTTYEEMAARGPERFPAADGSASWT